MVEANRKKFKNDGKKRKLDFAEIFKKVEVSGQNRYFDHIMGCFGLFCPEIEKWQRQIEKKIKKDGKKRKLDFAEISKKS